MGNIKRHSNADIEKMLWESVYGKEEPSGSVDPEAYMREVLRYPEEIIVEVMEAIRNREKR